MRKKLNKYMEEDVDSCPEAFDFRNNNPLSKINFPLY